MACRVGTLPQLLEDAGLSDSRLTDDSEPVGGSFPQSVESPVEGRDLLRSPDELSAYLTHVSEYRPGHRIVNAGGIRVDSGLGWGDPLMSGRALAASLDLARGDLD